jgi:hypothetical protein
MEFNRLSWLITEVSGPQSSQPEAGGWGWLRKKMLSEEINFCLNSFKTPYGYQNKDIGE